MPRYDNRYGMEGRDEDLTTHKENFVKRPLFEEKQSILFNQHDLELKRSSLQTTLPQLGLEKQGLFGNQANHGPLMVRTPEEIHLEEEYDSVRFSIHMRIRVKRAPYLRAGVLHIDALYVGYDMTALPMPLAECGVVPRADGSWELFAYLRKIPKPPTDQQTQI